MRMNESIGGATFMLLACGFLAGCAAELPSPEPSQARQPDPDIVVMNGLGGRSLRSAVLGVKPMAFEELASCGTNLKTLRNDDARLKAADAELVATRAEIEARERAIETDRLLVNARNAKQVEAFNKRVEQYRADVILLNQRVQGLNTDIAALKVFANQLTVSCANRAYRKSDLVRLDPEVRAAIESSSTPIDVPVTPEVERHDKKAI